MKKPIFRTFPLQNMFLEGSINLNDYLHGGFKDQVRDLTAFFNFLKIN